MSYGPRHTNVYASGSGSNTTISAHTTSNTNTNTSFLRQPNQTQSALQTRINSKRAELENLLQLRDLSANLANQLSTLEQKLGTLKDGAHSVALVLANWENVLRAINMAAMKVPIPKDQNDNNGEQTEIDDEKEKEKEKETAQELPVPLVRIPVQQMEPPVGG
ncbi:hypothetical protein PV05_03853 [Exophiala xenobiotica]|uniref:DASH complex subunit DAD2 n=1 Tax=Exophiala xenobiotica TaxID=348802 RepID=A0A0D2C3J7_9EURO|nr:uncharacterized protein PV05_03853 [Exophiala xenobiotica]KIW59401.1 hypothetical protein PV05_03853 [Exophiala xenobiotica]